MRAGLFLPACSFISNRNKMAMEEIMGYLEAHSNGQGEERIHRSLLDQIIKNPYLIGVAPPIQPYREVELLEEDRIIGRADLVIIDQFVDLYLVEAKVIRSSTKFPSEIRNELNRQLEKDFNFFRDNFRKSGTRIGVYRRKGGKIRHYRIPRPIEDLLNR
jgi:hypothetical protein